MTIDQIYISLIGVVTLVVILFCFSKLSKMKPKWLLLVAAIGLFLFGGLLAGVPVREMKIISGICSLTSVIGVVLGLITLCRKVRKPAES